MEGHELVASKLVHGYGLYYYRLLTNPLSHHTPLAFQGIDYPDSRPYMLLFKALK
jgi:hypothetical protein